MKKDILIPLPKYLEKAKEIIWTVQEVTVKNSLDNYKTDSIMSITMMLILIQAH
jgi:hypothetical protein